MTTKSSSRSRSPQVLVIGSGYAGTLAANRLAGAGVRVTVVEPDGVFVDRIRLHEVAAGSRASAATDLRARLRPRVAIRRGRVVQVSSGRALLADGAVLEADGILLATGSGAARVRPGTERIDSAAAAGRARVGIAALPAGGRVAVVGAGATGIEAAAEIAEQRPDLHLALVGRAPVGTDLAPAGRAVVRLAFARLGVAELRAEVDLDDRAGLARLADVVIDATGLAASPLATDSGLPVDPRGRVLVDDAFRVLGTEGLWAAGDAARIDRRVELRASCAVAQPSAAHAATQILRHLDDRPPEPFRFAFAARCLSLGRRHGLIQFLHADDTPRRAVVTGRSGAVMKEMISRGAAWTPAHAPRLAGPWPSVGAMARTTQEVT